MMKMVLEIGYSTWAVEPHDAILLLDIAARSIKVSQPEWGKPYVQASDQAPFVSKVELVEYEPLALPAPDKNAALQGAPTPPFVNVAPAPTPYPDEPF